MIMWWFHTTVVVVCCLSVAQFVQLTMCMRIHTHMLFNSRYRSIWWEFQMLCCFPNNQATIQSSYPLLPDESYFPHRSIEYSIALLLHNEPSQAKKRVRLMRFCSHFQAQNQLQTSCIFHVQFVYRTLVGLPYKWASSTWAASLKCIFVRQLTSKVIRMFQCTIYRHIDIRQWISIQWFSILNKHNAQYAIYKHSTVVTFPAYFHTICDFLFTGKNKNVTHILSLFAVIALRLLLFLPSLYLVIFKWISFSLQAKTCAHTHVELH